MSKSIIFFHNSPRFRGLFAGFLLFVIFANVTMLARAAELIVNGGVESLPLGTGWTLSGGVTVSANGGFSRSGSYFLFLGGAPNEKDAAYQTITIPATATAATLSFYYNINSLEGNTTAFDTFSCTIRNNSGSVLAPVVNLSNKDQTLPGSYTLKTFNLLPYANQTIRIHFASTNDSTQVTNFRVDDVSVQVTTVTVPTVQTLAASSVGTSSATLNGQVVSDGGSPTLERRIEWAKSAGNWGTGTSGVDYGFFSDATTTFNVSGNNFNLSLVGFLSKTDYKYRVWAKNSAGWSDVNVVNVMTFTTYAAPTISSIFANSGSTAGGNTVTIDGTNLESASSVTFGGTAATIAYNATTGKLQPTVPAHIAGTVDVTVTTPGGSVTLANGYTYLSPPTVTTQDASDTTQGGFQMNGTINPNGVSTDGYFEWGLNATLNSFTATIAVNKGSGTSAVSLTSTLNGRICGTTYYYRAVAAPTSGSIVRGNIVAVTTLACAAPVAVIGGDSSAGYGQSASFSGAGSTGTATLNYSWNFGDGASASGSSPTTTHNYYPLSGATVYRVTLTVTDGNGLTSSASRQITVTGQSLGTAPSASKSSDPVNLANGNYIYEHVDSRYSSLGFPFEFKRFYNSKDTLSTGLPLGFGWTHNFNIKLTDNATNLVLTFGDGHQETYIPTDGYYKGEPGVFSTVTNTGGLFMLQTKEQLRYAFDSQKRLDSIVDKNDNTLSLHYNGSGLLDFIYDTAGRTNRLEYNSTNCIVRIIDPLGRTSSFDYDAATNLVTATDANLGITRYEYDASNQMTAAYDPRNHKFVSNVYDAQRHVVTTQKDALLFETAFIYDFTNHMTIVSNTFGITRHFHDDKLRITNVIDTLSFTNAFAYDDDNNRTMVVDKRGYTTFYTYDNRGNVTSKTDALNQQTTIQYNALNNPIRRTSTLNGVTSFGYDGMGNLTSTTNDIGAVSSVIYDDVGQPTIVTDPNWNSTTNVFDAYGNVTAIWDALGYASRFVYDLVGRKVAQIDANNHTNRFSYDNNNNVLFTVNALNQTNSFLYDSNNNVIVSLDARGNGVTNTYDEKDRLTITRNAYAAVTSEYDNLDRKINVSDAKGGQIRLGYDSEGHLLFVTNAMNEVTSYSYDPNGNQTSITNNLGQVSFNTFDPLNRLIQTVGPLNRTNRFSYDPLGRRRQTVDANGRTNAFGFDAAGRLLSVTNALGMAEETVSSFTYDSAGNRLTATDPNGNVTTNVLDQLNRIVEVREPRGTYHISYDGAGNKVSQMDANGQTTLYIFDAANRLQQIKYPAGSPVNFGYDAAGNRTSMTDALGTSSWQYDKLNRLTNSIDSFGKAVGYVLDVNGNRTALIYPGNKVVSYEFDLNNRMISVSNWLGETTSYGYNGVGNLSVATNGNGSKALYGYDTASRLNVLTNLTPGDSVISSYNLVLDAVGNITSSAQTEPLTPLLQSQTVAYTYTNGNTLTSAGSEAYVHDANGNMRSKGTSSLLYDFKNRLTRLQTPSLTNFCSYDGMGLRLVFASNGVTRRFVLDVAAPLTQVLAETDASGNITAYYIYGLGLISKVAVGGNSSFYHFDQRGNTVALSDANGVVTDKYAYDPFGTLLNKEGTTANIFIFLGKYGIMDDGNGLSYIRARYYQASIGRFITKDPVTGKDGDGQSLNRYIYALNNAIRLIDPSGLVAQDSIRSSQDIPGDTQQWLRDFLLHAGISVSQDSLKAIADYFAAGGARGVPINFSVWTWEVTGQRALPLFTATLSRISSIVGKSVPFAGAGISGVLEFRETAGQNLNGLQIASRVSFAIGSSAGGSLAGPYAGAAIGIISQPLYDYGIEPVGNWWGANVLYPVGEWVGPNVTYPIGHWLGLYP